MIAGAQFIYIGGSERAPASRPPLPRPCCSSGSIGAANRRTRLGVMDTALTPAQHARLERLPVSDLRAAQADVDAGAITAAEALVRLGFRVRQVRAHGHRFDIGVVVFELGLEAPVQPMGQGLRETQIAH